MISLSLYSCNYFSICLTCSLLSSYVPSFRLIGHILLFYFMPSIDLLATVLLFVISAVTFIIPICNLSKSIQSQYIIISHIIPNYSHLSFFTSLWTNLFFYTSYFPFHKWKNLLPFLVPLLLFL